MSENWETDQKDIREHAANHCSLGDVQFAIPDSQKTELGDGLRGGHYYELTVLTLNSTA
jgi:hypothetical protein